MKLSANTFRLYAVTSRSHCTSTSQLLSRVARAIEGGAGIVQLREKHLPAEELEAEAREFVTLCRQKGVISIINDDAELAARVGADGVHVGQEDLACGRARALLGPDKIIGVSAHNVAEALAARAAGADYLGCGAAFVTGTKTDAKPITRQTLAAVTAAVDLPVVAIGGITQENLPTLAGCGLAGVAVVSALFDAPDVRAAAAALLAASQRMVEG